MPWFQSKFGFYAGLLVVALGATVIILASLAQGPDRDLTFMREIASPLSIEKLGVTLGQTSHWSSWFHSLDHVENLTDTAKTRSLTVGDHLKLFFDPKKGPWRKFQIDVEVLNYRPNEFLHLRVLGDSKGKLNQILSRLEWKIELVPSGPTALVRGMASARTTHWRSRLIGILAERILMNQVFYPDLIAFAQPMAAKIRNPYVPDRH